MLERIWAVLVEECEELGAACGGNGKLPIATWAIRVLGGLSWQQPHGPGQGGSKRSVLVDGSGVPLSVLVAGANVHDTKLLAITLDSIVV